MPNDMIDEPSTDHLHMIKSKAPLPLRIDMSLWCSLELASPGDEHLASFQVDDDELLRVILLQSGEDGRFKRSVISDNSAYVGEYVVYCER